MSRINKQTTQFTPAQFEEALKQFDVNKDGQLDAKDLAKLYNSINKFCPNIDTNQRIRDLQTMLLLQSDGKVGREDVKNGQWARSMNAYKPSAGNSPTGKEEFNNKMNSIQQLQQADLKDLSQPFKSDDAARELVLNHGRLMKNASFKDKVFLMLVLRDAGAGEWSHVGPNDQKAILSLLMSVDSKDRNTMLELAGGAKLIEGFMKGANLKAFQNLMHNAAPATMNKTSTTPTPKQTSSSNSGATCKSTNSSKNSSYSSQAPTSYANGSLAQSKEYGKAMGDLRKASGEVADLWKKYRATDNKEDKKEIMMEIQQAQQWETQIFQFISSMLKNKHSIAMGIIRNMP